MAYPLCGYSCVDEALLPSLSNCDYSYACTCQSSTFVAQFYSCVNESCTAADIESWTQYVSSVCAAYGVSWQSSAAPAPGSTTVVAIVATSTSTTTAVVVVQPTLVSAAPTGFATISPFFGLTVAASSTINPPVYGANPTSVSSAPTDVSPGLDNQSSNNTLSTGAIAGISIGVTGAFVFAVLVFLLWYRSCRRQSATPMVVPETQAEGQDQDWNIEKEAKTAPVTTVTGVQFSPELPDDPTPPGPAYKSLASPIDSPYSPLTPSPAYVEVPAHSLPPPAPRHSHSPPGFVEADSTPLSATITSPLSELEQPAFLYHELASSSLPSMPPPARELAAGENFHQATAPAVDRVGAEGEDSELGRMKTEIEALRVEKERLQQLQSIEARERELSQQIVERELAAQQGSGGGGGGPL